MISLRPSLALLAALLLPFALPPAAASDPFPSDGEGVFIAPDGTPVPVDILWTGPCNGEGELKVVAQDGAHEWTVPLESFMLFDACEAIGPSCFECPPLPLAIAWTLEGEDVQLAGTGAAYVWNTDAWGIAWSVQGAFFDGWLEFHGVTG